MFLLFFLILLESEINAKFLNCDQLLDDTTVVCHVAKHENNFTISLEHITQLHVTGISQDDVNENILYQFPVPERISLIDLSGNNLVYLPKNMFQGFWNLKLLNISDNQLHSINKAVFPNIPLLEQLILDNNPISTIPLKLISILKRLRYFSLNNRVFKCDCQSTELIKFLRGRTELIVSNGTACSFPIFLRGTKITDLAVSDVRDSCGRGTLSGDSLELTPGASSLVAETGKPVELQCTFPETENVSIEWLKDGATVENSPTSASVLTVGNGSMKLILRIHSVQPSDMGDWSCYVEKDRGSVMKTIRLMPISSKSKGCKTFTNALELKPKRMNGTSQWLFTDDSTTGTERIGLSYTESLANDQPLLRIGILPPTVLLSADFPSDFEEPLSEVFTIQLASSSQNLPETTTFTIPLSQGIESIEKSDVLFSRDGIYWERLSAKLCFRLLNQMETRTVSYNCASDFHKLLSVDCGMLMVVVAQSSASRLNHFLGASSGFLSTIMCVCTVSLWFIRSQFTSPSLVCLFSINMSTTILPLMLAVEDKASGNTCMFLGKVIHYIILHIFVSIAVFNWCCRNEELSKIPNKKVKVKRNPLLLGYVTSHCIPFFVVSFSHIADQSAYADRRCSPMLSPYTQHLCLTLPVVLCVLFLTVTHLKRECADSELTDLPRSFSGNVELFGDFGEREEQNFLKMNSRYIVLFLYLLCGYLLFYWVREQSGTKSKSFFTLAHGSCALLISAVAFWFHVGRWMWRPPHRQQIELNATQNTLLSDVHLECLGTL